MWDVSNEQLKPEFAVNEQKYLPILTVCSLGDVDKGKCKTEKCTKNEDCFSGICYSNTCVTKEPLYLCSSTDIRKKNGIYCGKIANSKCKVDEECFSNYCNKEGLCEIHKIKP
ncbi:hypothetical protein PIROE2DRAFT_65257 [Piromyces sp. E2]|nr:hypothetical protein PIROE2DRAFT_65257 [Piromyces sp. E2]|eukprot:OUM56992.1 hypothetical protein PIROE2DRAFT_65257 [Piromyces sp. E2]